MTAPTKCPKCGERWTPWPASNLPCHAKCFLAPEKQDAILRAKVATQASDALLAEIFDVSLGVIRASLAEARRRAGYIVAAWGR